MFPSRLGKVAVLAVAAGSPYVASETQWGRQTTGTVTQWAQGMGMTSAGSAGSTNTAGGSKDYPVHSLYEVETLGDVSSDRYRYETELAQKLGAIPADEPAPSLVGHNVADLREVLRFDLTTTAVLDRFSRVSTVLAELSLEGLRVPIVTGTRAEDLAGTLTYYFDGSGKVQRITLHGFTGNPQRLQNLLVQHYGLQSEPSLEAGVFTKRWNGVPVHFLRLSHAPVVYSDAVHQKYTLFLELNQPNLAYGISHEAKRIVHADQWTGRW